MYVCAYKGILLAIIYVYIYPGLILILFCGDWDVYCLFFCDWELDDLIILSFNDWEVDGGEDNFETLDG